MTAAATPTSVAQTTAPVSASTSVVNIELAQVYNSVLAATTSRQVMALGDPSNGNAIAKVVTSPLSGSEPALAVALAPNSADMMSIKDTLMMILIELKSLNQNLNGVTADNVPTN